MSAYRSPEPVFSDMPMREFACLLEPRCRVSVSSAYIRTVSKISSPVCWFRRLLKRFFAVMEYGVGKQAFVQEQMNCIGDKCGQEEA